MRANLSGREPLRVVLAPDVIGKGFFNADCREVLESWRDGAIVPVVTRDLLLRYVKLLRGLRIPDAQIRTWILWLTAEGKSLHLPDTTTPGRSCEEVLLEAANAGGAAPIVSVKPKPANGENQVDWITAGVLLKSLQQ